MEGLSAICVGLGVAEKDEDGNRAGYSKGEHCLGSHSQGSECLPEVAVSESDLGKLESDVKLMAQRILHYRANLPDQIKSAFASILAAQRPVVPDGLEPTTGASRAATSGGDAVSSDQISTEGAVLVEQDKETAEKTQLLNDKLSRNVSAMPLVLKRMKDCISTIDRLDSYNGIIHPAFKKEKTS